VLSIGLIRYVQKSCAVFAVAGCSCSEKLTLRPIRSLKSLVIEADDGSAIV
jgi:hypothetical protein